jgi:hypothetical protein
VCARRCFGCAVLVALFFQALLWMRCLSWTPITSTTADCRWQACHAYKKVQNNRQPMKRFSQLDPHEGKFTGV